MHAGLVGQVAEQWTEYQYLKVKIVSRRSRYELSTTVPPVYDTEFMPEIYQQTMQ